MEKWIGNAILELTQGDITVLAVDAIVNAANKFLAHGGGVALAIIRKGGVKVQEESTALVAKRGPVETGEAVITSGGKLPAKFVIHTVGPIWSDQSDEESDRLLCCAIRNSLALADEKKLKTIAFPAISTGIYGFPLERGAKLMLKEAADYFRGGTGLERVTFCLFGESSYRAFEHALAEP